MAATNENGDAGPDAAVVLALVTAVVPLPPATSAALRLVCCTTQLGVDQFVTDLSIPWAIASQIRIEGTPLTTGLRSLTFTRDQESDYEEMCLSSAYRIASYSSQTLETLYMHPGLILGEGVPEALAILGGHQWPNIRSLVLFSLYKIFETRISLDSMPRLTKLMLSGEMHPRDVAAMKAANHLSSTIQELEMPVIFVEDAFDAAMANFFADLPRLQHLTLDARGFRNLNFLNAADLPVLECFKLYYLDDDISLDPIASIPRRRLHTLIVDGGDANPAALIASGPETFPALLHLELDIQNCDWGCMRGIAMATLKGLTFSTCVWSVDDAAHLAAGLSSLPALETLKLDPSSIFEYEEFQYELTRSLILPNLRRVTFGRKCHPDCNAMDGLIQASANIPLLEEIEMWGGSLSAENYTDLADAGREGRWPNLRFFGISGFASVFEHEELDETYCKNLLHEVWPQLVILIGYEFDPDPSDSFRIRLERWHVISMHVRVYPGADCV